MILSFVPKRGSMPKWPSKGQGSYPFIGRNFDEKTRANVASDKPVRIESNGADGKVTKDAARLANDLCRRDGDLLPFDAKTAAFCGVPFVELERDDDGEWVQVPAEQPKAEPPAEGVADSGEGDEPSDAETDGEAPASDDAPVFDEAADKAGN